MTLKWKSRIPVIGIHQFSGETADKLKIMLKNEILPKNVRGIIFDFRNNPGGFLTTASKMGSIFRKKGETIFYTEDLKKLSNYQVNKDGLLSDFPGKIVVLQNKGTASASEIVAGALQDYHRAVLIGSRTYGKALVQRFFRLRDEKTGLKLTTARYYTPCGRIIQKTKKYPGGIRPDIIITLSLSEQKNLLLSWYEIHKDKNKNKNKSYDRQLKKAISLLQNRPVMFKFK